MKKTLLLVVLSFLVNNSYSQSGINTKVPKATLDVVAKNTDGSTPEGIIAPRVTGEALHIAESANPMVYGADQNGSLVYVTMVPTTKGTQTVDIDAPGYYYFDAEQNKWIKTFTKKEIPVEVGEFMCDQILISNTTFVRNTPYSGILTIPYSDGNVQSYPSTLFVHNGLTFVLQAGKVEATGGVLTYYISGRPTHSGITTVPFIFGNQSCDITFDILEIAEVQEFNCINSELNPSEISIGNPYVGTYVVSYTNGNGIAYDTTTYSINGLTFTLAAGTLAQGDGTLTYTVEGTPTVSGEVYVPLTIENNRCVSIIDIQTPIVIPAVLSPSIDTINCEDFTTLSSPTGTFARLYPYPVINNSVARNATLTITYKGGNGAAYPAGEPFTVGGLTFTLRAGVLASGSNTTGTLIYDVSGIPTYDETNPKSLIIDVPIDFYGHTCTFKIGLQDREHLAVKDKIWKRFNLGVITDLDANNDGIPDLDADIPVKGIIGNYFKWGNSTVVATPDTPSGSITNWSSLGSTTNTWSDTSKSSNDPCPTGFRVPSKNVTDLLLSYITSEWITSSGEFGNARVFNLSNGSGYKLTFPAAGTRHNIDGSLVYRGSLGYIWLSTPNGSKAYNLHFNPTSAFLHSSTLPFGLSVRCVSE